MNESLVDGNLLTGPAWPALHSFLGNLLKQLGTTVQA
jgi:putative intracellular protease/amidase